MPSADACRAASPLPGGLCSTTIHILFVYHPHERTIDMYWGEIFFVLAMAVLLSALLVGGFGWRHPRSSSPLGALLFSFLLVGVLMWAAAVWVQPAGPLLWGVAWAPLFGVGLLTILVVLALSTPARDPRKLEAEIHRQEAERRSGDGSAWIFGTVFWILVVAVFGTALLGEAVL